MSHDDDLELESTAPDDHDHDHDLDDDDVIYLVDDDGEETAWGFLGTVSLGENAYALLAPIDQLEDEESESLEVALYRYTTSDEGETFSEIEDDEERAQVEALATKFLEEEGFISTEE